MRSRGLRLLAAVATMAALAFTAAPVAADGMRIVHHIDTPGKTVALTFDDGWSPTRALEIAAMLNQYGATATFFPYANAAAGSPATWRQIAKQFPIGDHTTTHPNLSRLSPAQVFWEIDNARQVIEAMTGRPMIRMFRPPYMFYNAMVEQEAMAAGFNIMALWSIDTQDAEGADAQTIYNRAIKVTSGGIVLMHAGPAATVQALPNILSYFQSHGFTFVNLPELLGTPWNPVTTLSGGGAGAGGGGGASGGTSGTGGTSGPTTCECSDDNQLWWTGPVYVRSSPIFRAALE